MGPWRQPSLHCDVTYPQLEFSPRENKVANKNKEIDLKDELPGRLVEHCELFPRFVSKVYCVKCSVSEAVISEDEVTGHSKKKNCRVSLIGARGFCNITFYNNNILGKYLPDCRKTLEAVQDIFKPEKCKQSLGRLKILYIRRYRILKVTLNVYIKTRTLLLQGNSRKEFGR